MVLLFEDVHWADQESLDLLLACSRLVLALPIVLILTYRTEVVAGRHPLRNVLHDVIHDAHPSRIHLRALHGDDVWALVRPTYRLSARDEAALVAYLLRRGEGNPLFTRELLFSPFASGTTSGMDTCPRNRSTRRRATSRHRAQSLQHLARLDAGGRSREPEPRIPEPGSCGYSIGREGSLELAPDPPYRTRIAAGFTSSQYGIDADSEHPRTAATQSSGVFSRCAG